ncbi:MAG: O-antigen ligase family protein [Thermoleophilia bacterium]
MRGALRHGSLYILMAALLTGSLWRGAYFPTPAEGFSGVYPLFTPRWMMVALLLLAGAWELAALAAERRFRVFASPLFWLFAAFAGFSGASYFWSSAPPVTARDSLLLLALAAVLVVARGQLLRFPGRAAARLSWWLVYTAAFVAAWGIVTYILRAAPYANEVDGIFRAGGTLEYSNALGCFALMGIPFAVALMEPDRREDRVLLGVAVMMLAAAAILSLSRSAMVLLLLVSLYLLVVNRGGIRFVLVLASLGFGVVLASLSMLVAEAGRGWTGMALPALVVPLAFYLLQYLLGAGSGKALRIAYAAAVVMMASAAASVGASARARNIIAERFGEGFAWSRMLPHREDTWAGALEAFRERPLKGWGLGSFPQVYQEYSFTSYTKYAHNLVLQAAVDSGVIGAALMALFLLYVTALCLLRLARRADPTARAASVAGLVFICFNLFDWEWYVPVLAAWFMVVASLAAQGSGAAGPGEEAA